MFFFSFDFVILKCQVWRQCAFAIQDNFNFMRVISHWLRVKRLAARDEYTAKQATKQTKYSSWNKIDGNKWAHSCLFEWLRNFFRYRHIEWFVNYHPLWRECSIGRLPESHRDEKVIACDDWVYLSKATTTHRITMNFCFICASLYERWVQSLTMIKCILNASSAIYIFAILITQCKGVRHYSL